MPERRSETPFKPQPIHLEADRTALVIVDMQKDFVDEKGSLYGEASAAVVPSINLLIKKARDKEVPIIFTQDWHLRNDIEFKIWPKHCVKGSWGAEFTDLLERERSDLVIKKGTIDPWVKSPSGLKSSLEFHLRRLGPQQLVVTGTVANICVMHAIAGASIRGMKTTVPVDCIAPLNPSDLDLSLRQFTQVYKSAVTSSSLLAFQR